MSEPNESIELPAEPPPEPTEAERAMKVLVVEPGLAQELIEFYGPDRIVQAFDPDKHKHLLAHHSTPDELPELPA